MGIWKGATIKTVPGQAGHIWLSLQEKGISISTDGFSFHSAQVP